MLTMYIIDTLFAVCSAAAQYKLKSVLPRILQFLRRRNIA